MDEEKEKELETIIIYNPRSRRRLSNGFCCGFEESKSQTNLFEELGKELPKICKVYIESSK
jgi:hypothetical protein